MKTIIFVWTHHVCNYITTDTYAFWGLGDILRGIIHTYQLCKKYGYEFIVDIQLHPISNYLIYHQHKYSSFILSQCDSIKFIENTEEYIQSTSDNVIFFETNSHFKEPISVECKEFMRALLTPTAALARSILEAKERLPSISYTILHYRLGDRGIIQEGSSDSSMFIKHINDHKNDTSVLISDSKELKLAAKENCNIFMFDIDIGHIGYAKHKDKLKGTLIEFFICQTASSILTFSIYPWTSGFVKCIHDIYDIPLFKI